MAVQLAGLLVGASCRRLNAFPRLALASHLWPAGCLDGVLGATDAMDGHRASSGLHCSTSYPSSLVRSFASSMLQEPLPATYHVGLYNLRDNPGARKKKIRVGRGDAARRGNYCGRGMKGKKARGRAHILYDGGTLGLLKFPITRERPPYEVLYCQLGLPRLVNAVQLGLLDHTRLITMKDLQDTGCVPREIQYGVMLYGGGVGRVPFPIHIQVSACEEASRRAIEAAGGSVTRVYYTEEGLKAHLRPEAFTSKRLPLPPRAHSWHPRFNDKFDALGDIVPDRELPAPKAPKATGPGPAE